VKPSFVVYAVTVRSVGGDEPLWLSVHKTRRDANAWKEDHYPDGMFSGVTVRRATLTLFDS
jgi:hypothetical protein